jgi:hypothetical protein
MSRAQAVVVLVAVALAVVLAGVGLYAHGQPDGRVAVPGESVVVGEDKPGDPHYRPLGEDCTPEPDGSLFWDVRCSPDRNLIYGPVYDDAPLTILRSGAAPWWWFGAVAVLVLGAGALPLAARRR